MVIIIGLTNTWLLSVIINPIYLIEIMDETYSSYSLLQDVYC